MQTQVELLSATVFVINNALSDIKKHWKYMDDMTFLQTLDTTTLQSQTDSKCSGNLSGAWFFSCP